MTPEGVKRKKNITEQKYFVLLIGLGRRGKYNLLSGVFT